MTVNERLFDAGLLDAFEDAAKARDQKKLMRILAIVEVEDAARTIELLLENPAKYGI